MFEGLLGGLIDKENAIKNVIKSCLEEVAEQLGCPLNEIFIMIRPTDEKANFKCWIYHNNKMVREITLKEIIGDD